MPKKDGDEYIISESGNWNVADDYSKVMIMDSIKLCSRYEDIAYFGYESIAEELVNFTAPPNDLIRYRAINRLIKQLIKLIKNVKFALKKGKTKNIALGYKKQLEQIYKSLPNLVKITFDKVHKTRTFTIKNESLFEKIIDLVSEIRSKLNEPLNANHLIFTDKEEFDPKTWKDNMKRRMIEEG